MVRMLRHIATRLQQAGLQQVIPYSVAGGAFEQPSSCNDSTPLDEVSYLDDMMFAAISPSPKALLNRMRATTAIIIDSIASFGFAPNLKRGKTEIVLALRGPASTQCRRTLLLEGGLEVNTGAYGKCLLQIAANYKHMGGITSPANSFLPEIKNR
eukprot:6880490-Lingulodinium_polyedra.AAC.1